MPPRGPPSPGTPDGRRTTPTKESTSTQSEREPVQEKMWEDKIREHKENLIRTNGNGRTREQKRK